MTDRQLYNVVAGLSVTQHKALRMTAGYQIVPEAVARRRMPGWRGPAGQPRLGEPPEGSVTLNGSRATGDAKSPTNLGLFGVTPSHGKEAMFLRIKREQLISVVVYLRVDE
jgi:hypothetical protein